jgi:hypothetical protein
VSAQLAFEIWAGVWLALALASCVFDGWRGYYDPAGGVAIALLWPAVVAAFLIFAPFWLALKAGRLARKISSWLIA